MRQRNIAAQAVPDCPYLTRHPAVKTQDQNPIDDLVVNTDRTRPIEFYPTDRLDPPGVDPDTSSLWIG